MSFFDVAQAASNRRTSVCSVGKTIAKIASEDPALAALVRRTFATDDVTGQGISAAFRDLGYAISSQTVNRHRNGRCVNCPEKSLADAA